MYQICPDDSDVIVLGDGEFSSTDTLQWLDEYPWHYALRCARDTMIYYEHEWHRLDSFDVRSGETIWLENVLFTQMSSYGPVNIFLTWDSTNDRLLAIVRFAIGMKNGSGRNPSMVTSKGMVLIFKPVVCHILNGLRDSCWQQPWPMSG